MVDWTSGLLGGIKGAGGAVGDISRDQRKELAEHLKLQALDAMQGRRDERLHGQAKVIQAEDIKARYELQKNEIQMRKDLSKEERDAAMGRLDKELAAAETRLGKQITSHEKIAGEQIGAQREIAGANRTSQEKIASGHDSTLVTLQGMKDAVDREKITGDNAKVRVAEQKIKSDAVRDAIKAYQSGLDKEDALDQANIILLGADLPPVERYVKTPGEDRWWPRKDVAPTMGIRQQGLIGTTAGTSEKQPAGTATTTGQPSVAPTGAGPATSGTSGKSDLDRLLEEGKKTMPTGKPSAGSSGIVGEAMASEEGETPEPKSSFRRSTGGWIPESLNQPSSSYRAPSGKALVPESSSGLAEELRAMMAAADAKGQTVRDVIKEAVRRFGEEALPDIEKAIEKILNPVPGSMQKG